MSLPGFVRDVNNHRPENWREKWSEVPLESRLIPAAGPGPACAWWQWWIFPIACNIVQTNIAMGWPGYGASKCDWWQIPADPVGCAAV
jgi:hypothetical protein